MSKKNTTLDLGLEFQSKQVNAAVAAIWREFYSRISRIDGAEILLSARLGMNIGDLFEASDEPRRGLSYASSRDTKFR